MLNFLDFELKRYKRIRELEVPLMTEIGKALPTELVLQAARDLGMLGRDSRTLFMEAEDEIGFVMDRAIHDIPWPTKRWIEQICENNLQDYTLEQQRLLQAHLQPIFSLYEVVEVDPGRGVQLRDVFHHQELFLMDIGFGTTAEKGILLATRVITHDDLNFTSGAAMLFDREEKDRLSGHFMRLFSDKKGAVTWGEMMRRHAPYFFAEYRKGDHTIEFSHVTEKLRHEDQARAHEGPAKVGRNAPCPCGSGKKYKKCCLLKEEKVSATASAWSYAQKRHLIQQSENLPMHRCYINPNWKESGLARIVVTRSQENGHLLLGVFLVDIFCLGVKDAFCNADLPAAKLEEYLLSQCYRDQEPRVIGINYAKEIIFGAIEHALAIGFEPHPDFDLARLVLGKEKPVYPRSIQFGGPNGKPLYIAGPEDDAQKIVQRLRDRLGEDGFEFIVP